MEILEQALNKIKSIGKNKRNFLILLVQGFIGAAGKRTFRNLARYIQTDEHTISRQMKKNVDFPSLNFEMIAASQEDKETLIAAQDTSFVPKSGKTTNGIDFFWNGCAGKSEKGLEVDAIATIKINGDKKEGYTISARQTPASAVPKNKKTKEKKDSPTKIDFAINHLKDVASKLMNLGIKYLAADAFYAKIKYVDGVVDSGLQLISKLRKDARLLRVYTGPQKARGRKKQYEKIKINSEDFNNLLVIKDEDGERLELRSCIAYSPALGRQIKVVLLRKFTATNKYGEALLFSTDIDLDMLQIYQFYTARFQIEFIFRDAKGFTGFADCQSRDADRLHYHFNVSLLALNAAKLQDQVAQKKEGARRPFSMANWSRKLHVGIVINRFISMFGLDQTLIKSHPRYENMLSFGKISY